MTEKSTQKKSDFNLSFSKITLIKQGVLFLVLALSVSAGIFVVLWTKSPNLVPMYAQLSTAETGKVLDALDKHKIKYKYSEATGNILVAQDKVHEIRMKLAALGLPKSSDLGYEILDKPVSLTSSQFMESIRYRRSLEGELAKTIKSLDAIRNARIHLGMAKENSFIRRNTSSSASIMVDLVPGHILDQSQISGIKHLVSASVPGLLEENVSVIDNKGNLLSLNVKTTEVENKIAEELKFAAQKEKELSRKIKEILTPIYGENRVKAEVTVDMDFTYEESTRENFDANMPKIRSEKTFYQGNNEETAARGIPGAMSNMPPKVSKVSNQVINLNDVENAHNSLIQNSVMTTDNANNNLKTEAIRNYELDKSITHTKQTVGKILRLTVGVLIDDKEIFDLDGNKMIKPLSNDEITKIEGLVRDIVGFDAGRNDRVTVINKSFVPVAREVEPHKNIVEKFLEKTWLVKLLKQILAVILGLIFVFTVIKPLIKYIYKLEVKKNKKEDAGNDNEDPVLRKNEIEQNEVIEHVRTIAKTDTQKAAAIILNWLKK